jgi:hypothetical protein
VTNVGLILAGSGFNPRAQEFRQFYDDDALIRSALPWMTEQYDRAERKETWGLFMEIAITIFVAIEAVLAVWQWWRGR